MTTYILKRLGIMLITLFLVSIISFIIIQLPPGDFVMTRIAQLGSSGVQLSNDLVAAMRKEYGLDQPMYIQYLRWMGKLVRGDFGYSYYYAQPVGELLRERLPYSLLLALVSIMFVYIVSIPAGIISALRQRSMADYSITVVSFLGISIPDFLLALVIMYLFFKFFNVSIGGLFSQHYAHAAWSLGKLRDLIAHLWAPIIVVGAASTAVTIRVFRAAMLDELGKPYVQVARAKGIPKSRVILKYPTRVALNPIMSTIGYVLPAVISGQTIVAYVLDLPTIGPALLRGALSQDMYLVGGCVMIMAFLTILGTLISDLLLAVTDPRIRYQ